MTIGTLAELTTIERFLTRTVASKAASIDDCSAPRWTAPPMWKVRMVSWVPGLADRLGGDDAHRLADIDDGAARKIAAIALAAEPDLRLAGENRADDDGIDAGALDALDRLLVDKPAALDEDRVVQGIDHIDRGGAAEDAVRQGRDHLAALDDGAHGETVRGAAILLGDDRVLRHVDEPARQVARVRGLERRVGEALARAVRRVEVLEHGEAFLEVRDDRRLDDLARRLRHEAAHAGELLDLCRRTARARIGHHPHRD